MSDVLSWLLGGELVPGGHIEWLGARWGLLLAVVAVFGVFAASWFGARGLAARIAEAACWVVGLGAIVVLVARPVWVEETDRREPGRVAVLIDASRSMSVIEKGAPRSDQVAAIVASLEASDVDWYHYGAELGAGRPSAFDLPGTDLDAALTALAERSAGEKLAAVAVITDGIDRGTLRRSFREGGEARPALPGPLTVFQVGQPGELSDLSVRQVDSGGFAFAHASFTVRAHLEGRGFEGRTVPVSLTRDGAPVSEQRVQIGADGHAEVVFDIIPDEPGKFDYAVSVPVYDGDAVPANNAQPNVVRVVRDRLRVLQVAGAPTWDVKFLRRFLKGDPSVDLVSFFILRTDEDVNLNVWDKDELSLIPFPQDRLFGAELDSFDLVVFQDFDHQPYFQRQADELLENLRRYVVERGRGFAMIGGPRSFDLGGYGRGALVDVLPVRLGLPRRPTRPDDPTCGGLCDATPFRPALTDEGRRHPITRLVEDAAENGAWWERLHEADGLNLSLGAAPDAAVLLRHPTQVGEDGQALPVLAVREVGKGRVLSMTIDSSWRWSFSEAAAGRGNQAYLRFWKNAFRWLAGDPGTTRVSVDAGRENYALGEDVRLVVQARDPGFAPLPNAEVEVTVLGPGGVQRSTGVTGPAGDLAVVVPAVDRGTWRVHATVRDGEALVGEAETVYAVTSRDPELDDVIPDPAFTKWLAERTRGAWRAPGDLAPLVRDPEAGRVVHDRHEVILGRSPLLALLGLAGLGGAWIIRRRAGLR